MWVLLESKLCNNITSVFELKGLDVESNDREHSIRARKSQVSSPSVSAYSAHVQFHPMAKVTQYQILPLVEAYCQCGLESENT